MKTSILLTIYLTLTLVGCASRKEVSSYDAISTGGFYTFGFEASAFSPDNEDETWWVVDEKNVLDEIHADWQKRSKSQTDASYPRYRVFFSGNYSAEPGHHGHLGMYERKFIVTNVAQFKLAKEDSSNKDTAPNPSGPVR